MSSNGLEIDTSGTDVVLLVGGLGTRLRSALGEGTPKALALIRGRPFLWYLIRYLSDQGLTKLKLATAHLSESFQTELQSYAPESADIRFSFESSPRGTGGAVVEALPIIDSEPFIAMNGDSFIFAPLQKMLEQHRATGAVATIALVEVGNSDRFGTVVADEDSQISAFLEKTGLKNPGWINAGIYILSKRALEPILDRQVSSIERDVFPYWIGKGLYGFEIQSPFIDIGLPETYEAAGRFFEECGYV